MVELSLQKGIIKAVN